MAKPALINGKAYDWGTINVRIAGIPVIGLSSINYKDAQNIEDNLGAGNQKVSRGHGEITYDGSIGLHKEELEALQNASPTRRLQDLDYFDITVTYLNGAKTVTHKLKACTITENAREVQAGDTNIEFEAPLVIGLIEW